MSYPSLFSPAAFVAFLTALFLAIHSPLSATEAFLSQPVVIDEPDVAEEAAVVDLECDLDVRAMWYHFYVQKDGVFFSATWIRGDDAGLPENDNPALGLGKLPVGNYRFWVQAWEPVYGVSEWSEPDDFEVTCTPLQVCLPGFPRTGDLPTVGFWPGEFVFCSGGDTNPTATWGEIELNGLSGNEGKAFSRWVEYDYPGQGRFAFEQIPSLERFLSDGEWKWRCREYSSCAGIGPWSTEAFVELSGLGCSGAPLPKALSFSENHLYHRSSNTDGAGSTPSLSLDFSGVPWIEIFMWNVVTKVPFYQKWIYFTEDYNLGMPKLPPGDYEIWTRSYHHDCGIGEWAAVNTFTVQPVRELDSPYQAGAFRANGYAYLYFDSDLASEDGSYRTQPGVDWYQIYVTCGSQVIINQWVDIEDRTPTQKVVFPSDDTTGDSGQVVEVSVPCPGPVTFWLRLYSNAGEFGEWKSFELNSNFDGLAPINLNADVGPVLEWVQPGKFQGQFEVYVSRNGKLYFQDTVEAVLPRLDSTNSPIGPSGTLPTAWRSFHTFAPGSYQIWVRNVCGTGQGAWSEPYEFEED